MIAYHIICFQPDLTLADPKLTEGDWLYQSYVICDF